MHETELDRERRTIEAMIRLYCHDIHGKAEELCDECQELLEYAGARLERCPYRPDKPTCAKCPVHCYKQEMRSRVIAVMRYSGPRMIYRHPVLAAQHLLDGRKKPVR